MNATAHSTEKASNVRPKYIRLGIDQLGGTHLYRTVDETVFAFDSAGRIEYRFDVEGIDVGDYVAHVTDGRGWSDRKFGRDAFLDRLAEAI